LTAFVTTGFSETLFHIFGDVGPYRSMTGSVSQIWQSVADYIQ